MTYECFALKTVDDGRPLTVRTHPFVTAFVIESAQDNPAATRAAIAASDLPRLVEIAQQRGWLPKDEPVEPLIAPEPPTQPRPEINEAAIKAQFLADLCAKADWDDDLVSAIRGHASALGVHVERGYRPLVEGITNTEETPT